MANFPGQSRTNDLDRELLLGCSSFLAISLLVLALSVGPWFLVSKLTLLANLAKVLAIGLIPCSIIGAFGPRFGGIAPGLGYLGGTIVASLFVFLRMDQLFDLVLAGKEMTANYPESFKFFVPCGMILWALLLLANCWPKGVQSLPSSPDNENY